MTWIVIRIMSSDTKKISVIRCGLSQLSRHIWSQKSKKHTFYFITSKCQIIPIHLHRVWYCTDKGHRSRRRLSTLIKSLDTVVLQWSCLRREMILYYEQARIQRNSVHLCCINMLHFIPHKTAPCWFCESFVLQWMRQGFVFQMNKLTGRAPNTSADTYKTLDFRKLSKNNSMLKYSRFPIPL